MIVFKNNGIFVKKFKKIMLKIIKNLYNEKYNYI